MAWGVHEFLREFLREFCANFARFFWTVFCVGHSSFSSVREIHAVPCRFFF